MLDLFLSHLILIRTDINQSPLGVKFQLVDSIWIAFIAFLIEDNRKIISHYVDTNKNKDKVSHLIHLDRRKLLSDKKKSKLA